MTDFWETLDFHGLRYGEYLLRMPNSLYRVTRDLENGGRVVRVRCECPDLERLELERLQETIDWLWRDA